MYIIYSIKASLAEVYVIKWFMKWQNIHYVLKIDAGKVMLTSNGKYDIIIYDKDDNLIATGFEEFYEYWNKKM